MRGNWIIPARQVYSIVIAADVREYAAWHTARCYSSLALVSYCAAAGSIGLQHAANVREHRIWTMEQIASRDTENTISKRLEKPRASIRFRA